MKLWEILKEENLKKYVRMINMSNFLFEADREFYIISKNENGRIGLFACDGYQDSFLPSDIIEMEFEIIEKKDIIPQFKKGEKVKINRAVRRNKHEKISGIFISDNHYNIAKDRTAVLTIADIASGWLYEPIYIVEENDLVWSESMLDKIKSK